MPVRTSAAAGSGRQLRGKGCWIGWAAMALPPSACSSWLSRRDAKYLQTYHRIDIGLDTWPYNGHATSLDSFWMGVPVITLVGRTVVGRAGLSQLTNLGLAELIGHTPDEYVQIATELAGDLPRLRGASLRRCASACRILR